MTHEEEERQYDISNLKSQMQDIPILQRGTEVKLESMMDAKMNVLKIKIKGDVEELKGLRGDMEELKHSLERLLLERLLRGENASH